jgi:quinol-cytochrome oxidoreductase complex cytochrome b subunit
MFHLYLVQKHGNAVPPCVEELPAEERRSIPFFPNFLAMDLAMWLIALNVVTILATLFPWDLGTAADALSPTPNGIHPEWYFIVAVRGAEGLRQRAAGTERRDLRNAGVWRPAGFLGAGSAV